MELLLIAAVLGLLPAFIAQQKGHTFIGYWIFGALLFPVALAVVLLRKPSDETRRQCPHCRTWIDREAVVCARCARDVPPAAVAQHDERRPWERDR